MRRVRRPARVMTGEHAVGRVIARPFEGSPGSFRRREGRRDYSLVRRAARTCRNSRTPGAPVHGVGKIHDLFAGVGVDVKHAGATNAAGNRRDLLGCSRARLGPRSS